MPNTLMKNRWQVTDSIYEVTFLVTLVYAFTLVLVPVDLDILS